MHFPYFIIFYKKNMFRVYKSFTKSIGLFKAKFFFFNSYSNTFFSYRTKKKGKFLYNSPIYVHVAHFSFYRKSKTNQFKALYPSKLRLYKNSFFLWIYNLESAEFSTTLLPIFCTKYISIQTLH